MSGRSRDIVTGPRLLLRGFLLVLRTPKLLFLGALPALVTTVLFLGALITLLVFVGDLVTWATPFADSWTDDASAALRLVIGIALVGGLLVLGVMLFATVTLAIGAPCYDRIASYVDKRLGVVPRPDPGHQHPLRDRLYPIRAAAVIAGVLFVVGLVPVLGTTVVAVSSAMVGGTLLATELIAGAFTTRGLGLAERRRAVAGRRLLVLSFGVPVYLLCLVPFVAVIIMPAAVAGGTLLARDLLGEPTS